jgi:hypothetical protein
MGLVRGALHPFGGGLDAGDLGLLLGPFRTRAVASAQGKHQREQHEQCGTVEQRPR